MSPSIHNAAEIVTDLIRRERSMPTVKLSENITSEQALVQLESILVDALQVRAIFPSRGTTVACTRCGTTEAPLFFAKHTQGLYSILCANNGKGCWERSSRPACSYVEREGTECTELAEWVVSGGVDKLTSRALCADHVHVGLGRATSYTISPIQD